MGVWAHSRLVEMKMIQEQESFIPVSLLDPSREEQRCFTKYNLVLAWAKATKLVEGLGHKPGR